MAMTSTGSKKYRLHWLKKIIESSLRYWFSTKAVQGVQKSTFSTDGDTIAILPGFDPEPVIGFADIIIPTGMDILRNVIVANADAVLSISGVLALYPRWLCLADE